MPAASAIALLGLAFKLAKHGNDLCGGVNSPGHRLDVQALFCAFWFLCILIHIILVN